jgi:hypothetical protein
MNPPYITEFGDEGGSFDATGELLTPNEKAGQKAGDSATNASGSSLAGTAGVDLWDSGWPTGRYYWTVVPVIVQTKGIFDAKSDDQPIEYQDAAIPQDQCERGLGMSFGKVSSPVVTAASDMPYVAGLAPSGRYVAAASRKPEVHDSPLIAWQPAVGATQYEVQVSRKSYPWVPVKRLGVLTYSTATVLKLGPRDTGVWFYRVRGINPALPDGAQAMSWSKPVQIKITGDQFVVVK